MESFEDSPEDIMIREEGRGGIAWRDRAPRHIERRRGIGEGALTTLLEWGQRVVGEAFGPEDIEDKEGIGSAFEDRVLEETEDARIALSDVC